VEPQLRERRVAAGQELNNENLLAAALRHRRLPVRRFAPVAFLGCCDSKPVCFADARYERRWPLSSWVGC
jgi:hypothetical protein